MFTIQPATRSDAKAIRRLVFSGGINPTGLDWHRFVVAIAPDGRVIGCGQIKPHGDSSRELASIVVAPTWRGKGVARAIIERLLAEHPGELHLMCRSRLVPLYEKFGFQVIQQDEMPRYFRRINQLAGLVTFLQKEREKLAVMKR